MVHQQIVDELAQQHSITVVTSAYKDLPRHERQGNVEIYRVPVLLRNAKSTATIPSMLSYWPSSLRMGRRLLRDQHFDVINSHFAVPSSPSADQLARRYNLPHVLSIHGGDIFDPSKATSPHRLPLVRGLIRRLLKRADRVVAQSNNTADNARRYYDVQRNIDVIPLGIRPSAKPGRCREQLKLSEEHFVIVTVGRLVTRKRLEQLLHVVSEMNDSKVQLVVVGDGPKRDEWQTLASSLGIADQVRFTGFVSLDDRTKYLASADVFASTSEHEGFGLVFLEAMDQSLPVVTYDHGGQTDFLIDGITGGLVSLGKRDRFVEVLQGLKQSDTQRQRIGEHNAKAVQRFYISVCAKHYEDLFREVIQGQASSLRLT